MNEYPNVQKEKIFSIINQMEASRRLLSGIPAKTLPANASFHLKRQ
jgi:hypothetical protein